MNQNENRFSRQIGLVPRDKVAGVRVTVIGVGAIGRQVALQLASIGVSKLQVIDFDSVEATNVTTQGYRAEDIGVSKVMATTLEVERIDPTIEFDTITDRFRPMQETGSIVFCCVDSISARAAIWRSVRDRVQLWIDGRMLGEVIRVLRASDSATGIYVESDSEDAPEKKSAIFIGPEFGTVARADLVAAAREAADAGFDVLVACAFNYDAHSAEFDKLGKVPVLKARMNADLHMADELKNTGKGIE